jgi:hypothetical protein
VLATAEPAGFTLDKLVQRVNRSGTPITADELRGWLLEQGLAEIRDGRLVATRRGVELGELLAG